MGKQGVPQRGGVAHRRLGRKILRGQAAGKADESQQQQKAAPHQNIMQVVRCNAHIDDICHDQRHKQVKGGFQHLKERCKHAFALVALQVAKHPVQKNSSFGGQNTPYYNAMYIENPVPQLRFALYKLPNPVILELRLIGKYGEHNGKTNRRRGTLPPGGQPTQPHRTGVQPARHRLPGHRAGSAGAVQGTERGKLLVPDECIELRAGTGDPCAGAAADGAFGAGCARPVDGAPHPGGKGRRPCLVDIAQR